MRKATYTVVMAVMVALSMAVEQPATSDDSWLSNLQHVRPAASADTGVWMSQAWHPDRHWPAPEEEEAAWDPQDTLAMALPLSEEAGEGDEDVTLGLAKGQPPRRLGSVVDLIQSMARGLRPFVPKKKKQDFFAAMERRSGRRPAACRFGPFELVCWNAARRGAVMRQRSSQYSQ
ncbi:uncharacterized protein LOC121866515 [Homarus americanus]|uniref:Uncharacterized protein n=1 Tax=Homarus americanus TaxID=6706 RepID=A0A8J5KB89_HOMAM|nr:uncharacterized protein LOC121866515 [Homarus americanus]KAG7169045.1 hypothetical protein Hamer_G011745 [Homarus americanus]